VTHGTSRRILAGVALLWTLSTGCYHYYVAAPRSDPATEPQRRTVHSLAWGLVSRPVLTSATNCAPSNALDDVRVNHNLGYTLLTVATLGFWAPMQVEWRCAKQQQPDTTDVIREEL
jgi:hypothetical protein